MKPHMQVISHHKNIMDKDLGIAFFRKFDMVFMALDNQEARIFVNQNCMILDIPLMEAGTAGYLGQSMIIRRGIDRCY